MSTVFSPDGTVSVTIPDEVRQHLSLHFSTEDTGSKFHAASPEALLADAMTLAQPLFLQTPADGDGRLRIAVTFPHPIGVSNVVCLADLTDEERATITIRQRETKRVRVATSARVITTNLCQFVLIQLAKNDTDNASVECRRLLLITMYPGEAAPPLPNSPDIPDSYWDNHLFITNP